MPKARLNVLHNWRLGQWAEAGGWWLYSNRTKPLPNLTGALLVFDYWQRTRSKEPGEFPVVTPEFDWQWATLMFDNVVDEMMKGRRGSL